MKTLIPDKKIRDILHSKGISDLKTLANGFITKDEEEEFLDVSELSKKEFIHLVEAARLTLVHGIGEKWAIMLQKVGIRTIESLSEMTPEIVRMKLENIFKLERSIVHLPSRMIIAEWIVEAAYYRRKLQVVHSSKIPSLVIRIMLRLGIDSLHFELYDKTNSFEINKAHNEVKSRIFLQALFRTLFISALFLQIIPISYLIALISSRIVQYPLSLVKRIEIVLIFLITLSVIVLIISSIFCTIGLFTYFILFKCKKYLFKLNDNLIYKMFYQNNEHFRHFSVIWERILVFYLTKMNRPFILIIFTMCFFYFSSVLWTSNINYLQPIGLLIVLFCGSIGLRVAATDASLLKWIVNDKISSKKFFGIETEKILKFHLLLLRKRIIESLGGCIILLILLIIFAFVLFFIVIFANSIFLPGIESCFELLVFGFSKIIGFYYPINKEIDFSINYGYFFYSFKDIYIHWAIFSGLSILIFFYIGIPYILNRGRGFLFGLIITFFVGLIIQFINNNIHLRKEGLSNVYIIIAMICIYLLVKLLEEVLSKKINTTLKDKMNNNRDMDLNS